MIVRHLPALALSLGIAAMAESGSAEVVTGTFSGMVTHTKVLGGAPLPPADFGDAVLGCFRYDTADAEPGGGVQPDQSRYHFRHSRRSQFAVSVADRVWRSGNNMLVTVINDSQSYDDDLIDNLQVAYGPEQKSSKMYSSKLQWTGRRNRAHFGLRQSGSQPAFLISKKLPAQPEDLDLTSAVAARGEVVSAGPRNTWFIYFEANLLSMRADGKPVPGTAEGASSRDAALKAEALCEDQLS